MENPFDLHHINNVLTDGENENTAIADDTPTAFGRQRAGVTTAHAPLTSLERSY
ncbi:MAG: hypothetical protein R2788_26700 [Saprospiraceae bacterium]